MKAYNELVKSGQVVFTTFHQSYGYEEFIQGLRPDTTSEKMSFKTVDGVFKRIADKALNDQENNYVIIIDEISMVRADIIDFVDKVLRVYSRNMSQPFGGKQLLLVGDVYQLEPVVREEDRQLLNPFYTSAFFFDANVWREKRLVSIELQKIYRQSDPTFIRILDDIRVSRATLNDIRLLNGRVNAKLPDDDDNLSITLSTTRDTVDYINTQRLNELPGSTCEYIGEVKGDFPETMLPTLMRLEIKVGAQIIFIKNDTECSQHGTSDKRMCIL